MEKQPYLEGRPGRRGEYLVVIQILLMAAFVLIPTWPIAPTGTAYPKVARWLLCGLCWALSSFFGLGGFRAIRRYLTPLPYPVDDNRIVDTGVYRLVRHPIYTAIMLALVGWTLYTASLTHAVMTVASWIFYRHKAAKEEAWLTQRHPEYADYAARTGRFIPRLPGKR